MYALSGLRSVYADILFRISTLDVCAKNSIEGRHLQAQNIFSSISSLKISPPNNRHLVMPEGRQSIQCMISSANESVLCILKLHLFNIAALFAAATLNRQSSISITVASVIYEIGILSLHIVTCVQEGISRHPFIKFTLQRLAEELPSRFEGSTIAATLSSLSIVHIRVWNLPIGFISVFTC